MHGIKYFSKSVRGKGAPVVQAAALETYDILVHDCKGKTITTKSLMAGELLNTPLTYVLAFNATMSTLTRYQPAVVAVQAFDS